MPERALSLDLDGVVFRRPPFQIKAVAEHLLHRSRPYDAVDPVPKIPYRQMQVIVPPGPIERLSLGTHRRRQVFPDVVDILQSLEDLDIYGNTGRVFSVHWTMMTENSLRFSGVLPHFKGIYYRPSGISTRDSKLAAVAELREIYPGGVIHIDGNPDDGIPIAATFPDVGVIIMQDLTTDLLFSRREMEEFPNVRRVVLFNEVISKSHELFGQ